MVFQGGYQLRLISTKEIYEAKQVDGEYIAHIECNANFRIMLKSHRARQTNVTIDINGTKLDSFQLPIYGEIITDIIYTIAPIGTTVISADYKTDIDVTHLCIDAKSYGILKLNR